MTDLVNENAAADNRNGLLSADDATAGNQVRRLYRDDLKAYFHSVEALELGFSLSIVVAGIVMKYAEPDPRQRPIPYQYLESTGDYIVNQVNNEIFEGDTVSSTALFLLATVLPLGAQLALSCFLGGTAIHKTLCVYCTGLGLTEILTNAVKVYVGYLRPIFYDICVPDDTYENCTSGEDNGVRVSFPSGHSSLSFCGLGLLAFFLERRYGVSSLRKWNQDPTSGELHLIQIQPVRMERVFSVISYAPFLLAGFIAASRVADNKHFPADVVGGSILGASIAKMVHGVWYD